MSANSLIIIVAQVQQPCIIVVAVVMSGVNVVYLSKLCCPAVSLSYCDYCANVKQMTK